MLKHRDVTLRRLDLFRERLEKALYENRCEVHLSSFAAPGRIPFEEAMRATYEPISVGHLFGPAWSTHWVRVQAAVPSSWKGRPVHFRWNSGCEACVWKSGEPVQGMESNSHCEYPWIDSARGGEDLELFLEIACNSPFGVGAAADWDQPGRKIGFVQLAELGLFVPEAWDLLWDYVLIAECAQELSPESAYAGQALQVANAMVNVWQEGDRRTWTEARALAADFLRQRGGEARHEVSAIGHAHIDTAWLWPLAESRRKCNRSFSTALALMDRYPDFTFACSQAQQWTWMKEGSPGLYDRMCKQTEAGRFIPTGGTWIEPDCNLPSGESLVRQFLYGQRFFEAELGTRSRVFWNPDVFGYSAQLPQIMRGAGIQWFLTQKMSWNQFNKFPAHTFLWEGLDGSSVLTHFPPADTYNGDASTRQILFGEKNFRDHQASRHSCYLFGYGDGGGGPTAEMLERIGRMSDVAGLPRVTPCSPEAFFEKLEPDRDKLQTWVGELYLELHRGTYTTQAQTKKANRRSETLLRNLEFLFSLRDQEDYPRAELEALWKLVLLNQFHDILPGSSIKEVYEDARADYAQVAEQGSKLLQVALDRLSGKQGEQVMAFNALSHERREVVVVPDDLPGAQMSWDGHPLQAISVPPVGLSVSRGEVPDERAEAHETDTGFVVENGLIRAEFGRNGRLTSLYDKRVARELIPEQEEGNRLILFEDAPNAWEAWDVDVFHLEKPGPSADAVRVEVIESGPLRAALRLEFSIGSSSHLSQIVSLTAISARLDFVTEVDWQESRQFLKVEFPWALRSRHATYEIQFGHLERPTHANTSWDMARFEVCAHRWADLSEPDYGVALLNDCKYGYATQGGVMRLSLLRAPSYPDPGADRGSHRFTYALYPHPGTLQEGAVIEEGMNLNSPMLLRTTDQPITSRSWFSVDDPAVKIDTVKCAEDSDDTILRIYEAYGTHRRVGLTSAKPVQAASLCNLLEDELQDVEWGPDGALLTFAPFEIKTLKVKLG